MQRDRELVELLTALDQRRGKERVNELAQWCALQDRFDDLLSMIEGSPARRRGSISWVLARAVSSNAWRPDEGQREFITRLLEQEQKDAMTKRSLLDIFQYAPLPDEHLGALTDVVINLMRDPQETTAVRAFAITVLTRIMEQYPELYREVEDVLHDLRKHERPGLRVRARKAIQRMQKVIEKGC